MQVPAFGVRFRRRICAFCSVLAFMITVVAYSQSHAKAAPESVTLFAAASTTNALTEIVELYKTQSETRIRTVFAASSTLAKQIANGAPADLFLSANQLWVEHLIKKAVIDPDSTRDLLGNRLVMVVGPQNEAAENLPQRLEPSLPLDRILGKSRLAIGDPAHVPAGIYAKTAMQSLGLWDSYQDKLAFSGNVRTTLALVERGEAAAGIVYETDALILPELKIAGIFPANSHPSIVYPLAMVEQRRSRAVEDFYGFLFGPEASQVFLRHGFSTPDASK